jgi:ribosomal protein S18 acetylase RimI-like enzyme
MNSKPVIRNATPRDLDALTALENAAFATDRFSREQIEYLITRAHATILIMETDGRVAGSAYLLWRRKLPIGRLYNIAIDPGFQGQGLGAVLLDECEIEAVRRRCDTLSLEFSHVNK